MLYTPSHVELAQHPKTRKLARLLGVSIPTALGHLHLLWHFALKYAPDGDLSRFDNDEIADGMMWEGDSDDLIRALWSAGWTECPDDTSGPVLHEWDQYGGKAIRQTKDAAERQQRWRDRRKTETQQPPNESVTVTSPSHNALEENRGEEKRIEESVNHADAPTTPIPVVAKEPIPIKRGKPKTPFPDSFTVTDELRLWAKRSAPDVNVALQTERFENYWRGEGATKSDWVATWRNWILGEQDKINQSGSRYVSQAEINKARPGKFVGA